MSSRDLVVAAAGSTGAAKDDYFKNVSLLLSGDGTNGAQNNTFIAANGAAQGPFADPAGYWSVGFDGAGDYLSAASNAAFGMGTGDFTIETWAYFTAAQAEKHITDSNASGGLFLKTNATNIGIGRAQIAEDTMFNYSFSQGVWYHIAFVRNGSTVLGFVNGVQIGSATNTVNYVAGAYYVGAASDGSRAVNGYLSNTRLVKGTAVYTSAFTPSTTPLTAISGTSLLTCQSNVICDTSSNLFAITTYGNTAVNSKSPFTISSTYNPYSFSGYFDGTGDYLTAPTNAAFAFGTGDFTVEGWFYLTTSNTSQCLVDFRTNATSTTGFFIGVVTSGYFQVWNGSNIVYVNAGIGLNNWYHFAVSRNGSTLIAFINGVQISSVTNATNWTDQLCRIGYGAGGAEIISGYISNLRVVKGTAVYTSAFTPSNSPLTAITNTQLLTCQSSTFVDNSPNAFTITANGNAAVSTASNSQLPITRNGNTTQGSFSPYGDLWSNYFDGSGDYLSVPANSVFECGTGAFTIEGWVCPASTADALTIISSYTGPVGGNWLVWFSGGKLGIYQYPNLNGFVSSSTIPINVWTHFAIVRSSGVTKIYINGVQENSTTAEYALGAGNPLNIGRYAANASSYFNGYISNLRFVKGTAVYTSTFTPSTTPLTAVSGTSLLTCQSNRFKDNSSNNFTLTVNGNTSVQRFSPFNPTAPYSTATIGGSAYFDGTGDYIQVPQSGDTLKPLGNDFTIESWFYIPPAATVPSFSVIAGCYTGDWSVQWLILFENGNLKGSVYWGAGSYIYMNTGKTVAQLKGQWNHVALTRNGSLISVYVNGVSMVSTTSSTPLTNSTTAIAIGGDVNNVYGYSFPGYVSDFRMVIGNCLYNSTFTPNTTPLTAITNTRLLCNFINAGIPDAAMMNDLETVGNAQVSTSVKKYGTGSLAFDGTGDYLTMPNSPNLQLGSGNFTVEFWMYPTSVTGVHQIINTQTGSTDVNFSYAIVTNGTACTFYLSSTGTTWNLASGVSIGTIALNTWYHVALVRNGSTVTPYLNGVAGTTTSVSTTALYSFLGAVQIGRNGAITTTDYAGYIDDFRITKGLARYTANFTPPAQALPTQ